MTENSDENLDEATNALFYNAARFGYLEKYKQLMMDFGLKNPTLKTKDGELLSALNIAVKNTHSALSRVISKVSKEMADLNWNEISNQLEVPVKDDVQKLAYLNKAELMKQFVNEQVKGRFKKIVNCKTSVTVSIVFKSLQII